MTSPTTDRRFGVNSGLAIKVACRCATTANITLSGNQTIDGIATATNDRVLVKNQTDQTQNGIYTADSGVWSRALDFDDNRDVANGTIINVVYGSNNANTLWRVTTANPITINTSSITFSQNSASAGNSSAVSFLQAGTGAYDSRNVREKLREVQVSITDFTNDDGTQVSTSASDNATGIAKAITYLLSVSRGSDSQSPAQPVAGILFTPAGEFKTSGNSIPQGYNNITLRGEGWGSWWKKIGGTSTPVLTLAGDTTDTFNSGRCLDVTIEHMGFNGVSVTNMGIYLRKGWKVYIHNVYIINCLFGIYGLGSSEIYITDSVIYGNSTGGGAGIYMNGRKSSTILGSTVTLDKGFNEDFSIKNCWLGYNENAMILDHASGCIIEGNYYTPYTASAILIRSSGAAVAGYSSDTANVCIEKNWFESNGAAGYGVIEIQNTDVQHMRKIKVHGNYFIGQTDADVVLVQSGINGIASTGKIFGLSVKDNTCNYSATSMMPGFLSENPIMCFGTTVQDNFPIGMYGGNRVANDILYPEFTELVYRPTSWDSTANANPWAPSGWTASTGVTKVAVGDSYNGFAGPQLGDGAELGELLFYYSLDVQHYRGKVLLISFLCKANVGISTLTPVQLFVNGAGGDYTNGDGLYCRISKNSATTSAEAADPQWRRFVYFFPIDASAFGSTFTSTLLIRFARPASAAGGYVRIADLQIWATNHWYSRNDIT